MKKINPLITLGLCMLLLSGTLTGQKETYNWHFGIRQVYKFGPSSGAIANCVSSANTTPTISSMATFHGGSGSISDASGNLIFYTDAETIWGASNTPLPNGTAIFGSKETNKGVAIAKQPSTNGPIANYYVFTVSSSNNLHYSIVRTDLTSTVVTQKNITLSTGMSQKMAITSAPNCTDVWVVTHNYGTSFYAYKLTSAGLSLPVISTFTTINAPAIVTGLGTDNEGCMKISPNGQLLAMNYESPTTGSGCALFKFNTTTGVVTGIDPPNNPCVMNFIPDSDPKTPDATGINLPYRFYGVEFSPNSKVLYTNAEGHSGPVGFFNINCGPGTFGCIQYDVSTLTSTAINASRRIAAKSGGGMMQLGADGRIYLGDKYDTPIFTLSAIEKPNILNNSALCSNDCAYNPNVATGVAGALNHGQGLPLFNSSYFSGITPPILSASAQTICGGSPVNTMISLSALTDPGVTVEWRTDCSNTHAGFISSGNPIFIPAPNTTTTYYARVKNACGYTSICVPITITIINIKTPKITGNTNICTGQNTLLNVLPVAGYTYNWMDVNQNIIAANTTTVNLSPAVSTTYYLQIITPSGCTGLFPIPVTVSPTPNIGLLLNATTCGECVNLGGTLSSQDYNYSWSPATNLNSTTDANPVFCPTGISSTVYTVNVTDITSGCSVTQTQTITSEMFNYDAGPGGTLNDPTCLPQSSAIFGIPVPAGYGYAYNPTTYITAMNANGTVLITHPGNLSSLTTLTYTVTAISPLGCESSDILVVSFTAPCPQIAPHNFGDEQNKTIKNITGETESGNLNLALTLLPNPNNGEFKLSYNGLENTEYVITITNFIGEKIYATKYIGGQQLNVNLPGIQKGIYLVTLSGGNTFETKKLVIE